MIKNNICVKITAYCHRLGRFTVKAMRICTPLLLSIVLLTCCKGVTMTERPVTLPAQDSLTGEALKKISRARIYFGHQSVGYNILEGVADILTERGSTTLHIVESDDPGVLDQPALVHSKVGRNSHPASKADAFRSVMEKGFGNKADIAFFKLCYVDMKYESSPREIFSHYCTVMDSLAKRYPDTRFLHVTMPVTAAPGGLKATVKKTIKAILGQPVQGYDDNVKRHEFNELMRATFGGTGSLFDLALIESVGPDGRQKRYTWRGQDFVQLVPAYTYDGGHLNPQGRRFVAEQFLIFLAGQL